MNLKEALQEKKNWHAGRRRVKALPKEYRLVYEEAQKYLFKGCWTEGIAYASIMSELLAFFEQGAAAGKDVLTVTGRDVAAFCDGLLTEN